MSILEGSNLETVVVAGATSRISQYCNRYDINFFSLTRPMPGLANKVLLNCSLHDRPCFISSRNLDKMTVGADQSIVDASLNFASGCGLSVT